MNPAQSDLISLVLGIGGVLTLASVIGYVLQRRLSPNGANASAGRRAPSGPCA